MKHILDGAVPGDDQCFLCLNRLDKMNRTDEHVFPKWLQSDLKLHNQTLTLLNGTNIPYRQITIPCCAVCNNGKLSDLEADAARILRQPFRTLTLEEEEVLFKWCSKLLYGLLRLELRLLADRTRPDCGPILQCEFLRQLSTFRFFMESIRISFDWKGFTPYSLILLEAQRHTDVLENFDYVDCVLLNSPEGSLLSLAISIRVNSYAMFLTMDDGHLKTGWKWLFDQLCNHTVTAGQFVELACMVGYQQSLLNYRTSYVSTCLGDPVEKVQVTRVGFPQGNIWKNPSNEAYVWLLYQLLTERGIRSPHPEQLIADERRYTLLCDVHGVPLIKVE